MTDRDDLSTAGPDSRLDERIRTLVARAAADAPPAPELPPAGTRPLTVVVDGDGRRPGRWIVGGISALTVAAAIVALLVVTRPDDTVAPVTPAVTPAPADTAASPAGSTGPTPTEPPPTEPLPSEPPTTEPPTTDVPAAPAAPPTEAIVAAGPNGVTITRADDTVETVTTEPMAMAVLAPDGRVFMQRSTDFGDTAADTTLLVASAGSPPQPAAVPAALEGPMRIHDLAVVGGDVVLLVETGPPTPCAGFDGCDGSLVAFRPDANTVEVLDRRSVWEGGWSRMSLSDTGVVVGSFSESVVTSFTTYVVGGATAVPPDVFSLGLESQYVDCADCPTGFVIDRQGRHVAWLVPSATRTVIAVATIGDEMISPLTVEPSAQPAIARDLDITAVTIDAATGTLGGRALVSQLVRFTDADAVIIDLASGATTTAGPATMLTFG